MQLRPLKKRPNLEAALKWVKEGHFSIGPEDWLSDEQQAARIKAVSREMGSSVKQHFPRTNILEYAILKGHLIVERAIADYIRCHSAIALESSELQFTFAHKVEVATLMGLGLHDPIFLPSIQILNKLRNKAAHSFDVDRKLVDQLIKIGATQIEGLESKTDRNRIKSLRRICWVMCIQISAQLEVDYWRTRSVHEESLKYAKKRKIRAVEVEI